MKIESASRFVLLLVVAVALVAAPSAAADDYCVAPNATCGGTNVATLEDALGAAATATNADRIFLGAGTYTAPVATGYTYVTPNSPVEIIGQGVGQTVVTSQPSGVSRVLRVLGGPGTSARDLTIKLPQNAGAGLDGLHTDGVARRIEVVEDPTQSNDRRGVTLEPGASLEDSSVTLGTGQSTTAVRSLGAAMRNSTVHAVTGVKTSGTSAIERSFITGKLAGVVAVDTLTIGASVVRATAMNSEGIDASPQAASGAHVTADGVTIIGPALPHTLGVYAGNFVWPMQSADITLTNSVIRGFETTLEASTPAGAMGSAKISASYSDYAAGTNHLAGNTSIVESNISNAGDAGFVDAAGANFHPAVGSPLIDAGDPSTPQGLDLDGHPLVIDGDSDGIVRRDIGAYESPMIATPPAPGGDAPATTGDQPATTTTAPRTTSGTDTDAPVVSGFRSTNKVFAVGPARTATLAAVRGTRFRYTLSEGATATLKIKRRDGRTVGKLIRSGRKGANTIRFSGRIGKRALKPGRYRAVLTAIDAAAHRSTAKRVSFRIVR
jgi:hypothetical protein